MNYIPPPSTLPPGSIVDSYRRDSGGAKQDQSTAQQLAEINAYCKQYNLIHRNKFVDDAKSGGTLAGREDFNRMLALYENPTQRPVGLLLWNYARFARDVDDAQLNKIVIRKKWGIVIHSLNDQVPEGDYGRFIEFFIDMANEEKRKQTAADTKRGLRDLVEQYGCVPGGTPLGFIREPLHIGTRRDGSPRIAHRWRPDPKLAKTILKAFQLSAARISLGEIHKQTKLYRGINSYTTFFSNPIYKGTLVFSDYIKENYCNPMVPPELWSQVQAVQNHFARSKHTSSKGADHPRRANSRFILSGISRCARCDSPLYGHSSKQKSGKFYDSYFCTRAYRNRDCSKKRIPREIFENAVANVLSDQILTPRHLQAVFESIHASQSTRLLKQKAELADVHAQLGKIQKQIKNVTNGLADHGASKALVERLRLLELQETELQSQLTLLEASAEEPVQRIPPEIARAFAKNFKTTYEKADLGTRRFLLRSLIDHVDVQRDDKLLHGIIYFKYPPPDAVPTLEIPSGPQSVTD